MNSIERTKTIIEGQSPTPLQMRQLVLASMAPALEYQGLKRGDRSYYVRDAIDSLVEGEGDLIGLSHRVGVYLGKFSVGLEQVSRRLLHVEMQRMGRLDGSAQILKKIHRFEWNDQKGVYIATRSIRTTDDTIPLFAPERQSESIEDALCLSLSEQDYRAVTRAECDNLISTTRAYYDEVARIRRDSGV